MNSSFINRKDMTIFEFDKLQFQLKKELIEVGISEDDIKVYVEFLKETGKNSKFTLRDSLASVVGIFGSLGLTSILQKLFPNTDIPTFEEMLRLISRENVHDSIITVFTLFLILMTFILSIWVMVKIANIDILYRDKQRYFLLERLIKIWSYVEDTEITNIEEVRYNENNNVVYSKIPFSRNKFDKLLDEAIGKTFTNNFSALDYYFIYIKNFLKRTTIFLLGYLFPLLFLLLAMYLEAMLSIAEKPILFSKIAIFSLIVVLYLLIFPFYLSQMDNYTEGVVEVRENKEQKYKYNILRRNGNIKNSLIFLSYFIPFICIFCKYHFLMNMLGTVVVFVTGRFIKIQIEEITTT